MPRRRRKSSFQSKPSLIFTESPVNIVKNVPSPVLCARYPPTATSVPVEELDELTWSIAFPRLVNNVRVVLVREIPGINYVLLHQTINRDRAAGLNDPYLLMVSPQFTRVPNTVRAFGRRVLTRRRKSLSTVGTNKENTVLSPGHTSLPNRQNKFKSLKFIGEKTVEESLAEEVNISFESESISEVDSENDVRISEQDSPVFAVSGINKTSLSRKVRKNCANGLTSIHRRGNNHQSTPVDNSRQSERINDNGQEKLNDADESSLLDLTRLKPKAITTSPVKRLFASQINLSDYINDQNVFSTIEPAPDSDSTACNEEMNHGSETDTSNNCISDIDKVVPNSDSDLEISATSPPSVRRSKRLRLLRQILENGLTPNKDAPKVIVPDTPDDKYGWPLRKYQIKDYLLNKR